MLSDVYRVTLILLHRTLSVWLVMACCWPAVVWRDRSACGTRRRETVLLLSPTKGRKCSPSSVAHLMSLYLCSNSSVWWCFYVSLRRSSSSGCWEHRNGWDHKNACEPDGLLGAEFREVGGGTMGGPDVDIFPIRRRTTPARPALFGNQPDLTPLIDTNFGALPPSQTTSSYGFDFGGLVEKAYHEHETSPPLAFPPSPPPSQQRRRSLGDQPGPMPDLSPQSGGDWDSSVWAMELRGNLIATGRSSGKLEVSLCLHLIQYAPNFRLIHFQPFLEIDENL